MDMNEIKAIFFQECEEQLAELETGLLAMNDGDDDPETINAVFRAVHSIKGGAGAFALEELVDFAHVFETALDCIRSKELEPTRDIIKVMLKSADVLADLTTVARDGGTLDTGNRDGLVETLRDLAEGRGLPSAVETETISPSDAVAPVEDDAGEAEPAFSPVVFSFDEFEADAADHEDEAEPEQRYQVRLRPKPELYLRGNETLLLLRELQALGKAETRCHCDDLPPIDELDPAGSCLEWTVDLVTTRDEAAIRAIFEFAEWDCDLAIEVGGSGQDEGAITDDPQDIPAAEGVAQVAANPEAGSEPEWSDIANVVALRQTEEPVQVQKTVAPATSGQSTIRVDLERIDRLINLVGELVINQAMLAQSVTEMGTHGSSGVTIGLEELQQLTREIQDSVMAIRAQPVKPIFQRMSRTVREAADLTGKQVRLVTEGEYTEVDKTVIDKLAEPLTHMVRNAVDHGLEAPEARLKAGKDAEGTLRLTAKHRSGRIVIEIADDGSGIDRDRVRRKAIERGLISQDASLTNEEIDNLIFHPGFSTAEQLSDISGRGVGMDVVKRSIQGLGGRISIASEPGRGSVFTLSLPLTLAVLDGMVVTVAGQTLVVPLTSIIETLKPEQRHLHGFGADGRLIAIRDSFNPLVDVGQILNFTQEPSDPLAGVALLVDSEDGGQSALLVDAIQGQRQVVIKSLEANYANVPGIAAATILGDGQVALIVDVEAVVSASRTGSLKSELSIAAVG